MDNIHPPVVSILIPLYNHEMFIRKCLDSIIGDDYPAKEIVIIDDGSSDNSVETVNTWYRENDGRFRGRFEFLVRPNKGLTKTLNELISLATGEFIILLASDDYLLPGGIRPRIDYLLGHKGKMAVFADCAVVDASDKVLAESGIEWYHPGRKKYLLNDQLLPYEIVFFWSVPGPVFMARRSVYEMIGNYDESLAVEDWDFYLRLCARELLGFVDTPVAAYRIHGENTILNMKVRIKHFESLMLTAWKNRVLFKGIKKYKLIEKACELKHEILKLNGMKIRSWYFRRMYKYLNKITKKTYQKKVEEIDQLS